MKTGDITANFMQIKRIRECWESLYIKKLDKKQIPGNIQIPKQNYEKNRKCEQIYNS
jgi:hypothetical protein